MSFVTGDTIGDSMGEFLQERRPADPGKSFTRASIHAFLAALIVRAPE